MKSDISENLAHRGAHPKGRISPEHFTRTAPPQQTGVHAEQCIFAHSCRTAPLRYIKKEITVVYICLHPPESFPQMISAFSRGTRLTTILFLQSNAVAYRLQSSVVYKKSGRCRPDSLYSEMLNSVGGSCFAARLRATPDLWPAPPLPPCDQTANSRSPAPSI